jgi:hypothetical protein
MNTDIKPAKAPPASDNRNVDLIWNDELEKYRLLEELARMFLTSKRHHPNATPLPAHC